ncbi:MAG TPA: hypothetical protein VNU97_00325 [Rhizomicrobium sp.]|nr:hypothetical protein [Rhizomicrobium sp.]
MRIRSIAAVAGAVLLALHAAQAGDAEVAAIFGLAGTWQVDCGQPAAADNPQYTYWTDAKGTVHARLNMRVPAMDGTTTLSALTLVAGGRLRMVWTNDKSGAVATLTFAMTGGKLRSLESVGTRGEVYVHDGKLANGTPTQWFARCVIE